MEIEKAKNLLLGNNCYYLYIPMGLRKFCSRNEPGKSINKEVELDNICDYWKTNE